MELLMELGEKLNISEKISNLQENFLQKNWGEAINNAVDTGLRAILPNFIENEIIDVKDALIKGGLVEGIKTAIDGAINKGKEIAGMITGNIKDISQAEAIVKNGSLIEKVANVLDNVVDKVVSNKFIKEGLSTLIKNGKDTILGYAKENIEKINKTQMNKINKLETYIQNWEKYFEEKDFSKMQQEYKKIQSNLEAVLPIETILNKAKVVENLHNLIKNNGKNFDLSEEELELAKMLG